MHGRRLLVAIAVALLGGVSLVVAGLFWPAPSDVAEIHCGASDGRGCVEASGRVVWVQSRRPQDRIHAVLLSRRSLTLPGIVAIKLPSLPARPRGLGVGRWIDVVGADVVGSHGKHDIHVVRMVTADAALRCAWGTTPVGCRVRDATARSRR